MHYAYGYIDINKIQINFNELEILLKFYVVKFVFNHNNIYYTFIPSVMHSRVY